MLTNRRALHTSQRVLQELQSPGHLLHPVHSHQAACLEYFLVCVFMVEQHWHTGSLLHFGSDQNSVSEQSSQHFCL